MSDDVMAPELTTGPRRYSYDLRERLSSHGYLHPRPNKNDTVTVRVSVLAELVSWAGISNPDNSDRYKACLAGEAVLKEWLESKQP